MLVKIQNVVTTADLYQRIDVPRFNNYHWGEYDYEYYGGRCGYVKDEKIKGKVTVFVSGKMISLGAKKISESIEQLEIAMYLLSSNNLTKIIQLKPKVRNIVATADFEKILNLDRILKVLNHC